MIWIVLTAGSRRPRRRRSARELCGGCAIDMGINMIIFCPRIFSPRPRRPRWRRAATSRIPIEPHGEKHVFHKYFKEHFKKEAEARRPKHTDAGGNVWSELESACVGARRLGTMTCACRALPAPDSSRRARWAQGVLAFALYDRKGDEIWTERVTPYV